MSTQNNGDVGLVLLSLDKAAVYKDTFNDELISAGDVISRCEQFVSGVRASIQNYLSQIEPASPVEAEAYLTGLCVTANQLRDELCAQLVRMTGCYVQVDIRIHSNNAGDYPLFGPAHNVLGAMVDGRDTTQWVKLAGETPGEVTIYGRKEPEVTE